MQGSCAILFAFGFRFNVHTTGGGTFTIFRNFVWWPSVSIGGYPKGEVCKIKIEQKDQNEAKCIGIVLAGEVIKTYAGLSPLEISDIRIKREI